LQYCYKAVLLLPLLVTIRHELGLDRPVSASSNSLFKIPPSHLHLFYNSTLFLPPCCCSFSLHVVVNLVRIFLVSRQMVLFSTLPKISSFFLLSKSANPAVLKTFLSIDVDSISIFLFEDPDFSYIFKNGETQCIIFFYSKRFPDQSSCLSDLSFSDFFSALLFSWFIF